jgi:hypothetical protein
VSAVDLISLRFARRLSAAHNLAQFLAHRDAEARSGKLEADKAARLIWMLREIRGCLDGELNERLEEKMAVLQQRLPR